MNEVCFDPPITNHRIHTQVVTKLEGKDVHSDIL